MKQKKIYALIGMAAAILLIMRRKQSVSGMNDPITTIENVRRGVKNGWYKAELTRKNGVPAIRLSGTHTDGTYSSYIYPITEVDWQTLKSEGYKVV